MNFEIVQFLEISYTLIKTYKVKNNNSKYFEYFLLFLKIWDDNNKILIKISRSFLYF